MTLNNSSLKKFPKIIRKTKESKYGINEEEIMRYAMDVGFHII